MEEGDSVAVAVPVANSSLLAAVVLVVVGLLPMIPIPPLVEVAAADFVVDDDGRSEAEAHDASWKSSPQGMRNVAPVWETQQSWTMQHPRALRKSFEHVQPSDFVRSQARSLERPFAQVT